LPDDPRLAPHGFVPSQLTIVSAKPSTEVLIVRSLGSWPYRRFLMRPLSATVEKSGKEIKTRYAVRLWIRDRKASTRFGMSAAEAGAAVTRIVARAPWAAVKDVEAFERRWKENRAACERHADSRRGGGPGPVPALTIA
jgi:hypothetical protein